MHQRKFHQHLLPNTPSAAAPKTPGARDKAGNHCESGSRFHGLPHLVRSVLLLGLTLVAPLQAAESAALEPKPADAYFEKYHPVQAPAPGGLLLKEGDLLAICGDSITEQKMYSRIMETYLTVCVPDLNLRVRQFGWSGEVAAGFLRRMTNDCLRFHPDVATTSYGMNDYKYRPYDEATARWYRTNYTAVVDAFQSIGTRVVLGSPGCVGKVASWVKTAAGTLEEHNLNLCALRNIDVEIAREEGTRFADIFWPMFTAGFEARHEYGNHYEISGRDGVHPGWAGHLLMTYEYLRALGLPGDIGTFEVDLARDHAAASRGHHIDGFSNGELTVTSRRYPFCAAGDKDDDQSIRSGMSLVPFNQDLNRLLLIVRGGKAERYEITWGPASRVYSAADLAKGVNLAADFSVNPFSDAFKKVDEAVAAKQAFETVQIKKRFHSREARAEMDVVVAETEAERTPLVKAIHAAFVPVTHTIRIEAR